MILARVWVSDLRNLPKMRIMVLTVLCLQKILFSSKFYRTMKLPLEEKRKPHKTIILPFTKCNHSNAMQWSGIYKKIDDESC